MRTESKKSECISVFSFLFLARFETFLKWSSVMFAPAMGFIKNNTEHFLRSVKRSYRGCKGGKPTLQESFSPVFRVCWLEGGQAAEAQCCCHPAAASSRLVCSSVRARRARRLCLQSPLQPLPQVPRTCPFVFFLFYPMVSVAAC